MRIKLPEEPKNEELNMTPMIDVVFQLLIFFMCSLHFKTLEGKMTSYLPKDKGLQSTAVVNPILNEVGVFLDFDKKVMRTKFSVGNTRFEDYKEFVSTIVTTYQGLAAAKADKPPVVKIRPTQEVPFRDVVKVLDSCKAQGIINVEFEAAPPPGKS